jgi:hypothetical protein
MTDAAGEASADAVRFVPIGPAGQLTMTFAGNGTGNASVTSGGVSCGSNCILYPGGTVVTMTPVPAPGSTFTGWTGDADCTDGSLTMTESRSCIANFSSNDIVIDNGQAGATFAGTWTPSTAPNPFGANSLVNAGAGLETYTWTPSIPAARSYAVYVWWTSDDTRSETVAYTIRHSTGQETLSANQRIGGGQWQLLGTFPFAAGTTGSVEVSDVAGGGTVSADAVRFVPQ